MGRSAAMKLALARIAFGHSTRDLTYANYSSEPYFVYKYENIDTEGPHQMSFAIS